MNHILIIDDDRELCALMKNVELENYSAQVAHGGSGRSAAHDEQRGTCSLIILDIMMPVRRISGLEKKSGKPAMPVLMLTAKSDERQGFRSAAGSG